MLLVHSLHSSSLNWIWNKGFQIKNRSKNKIKQSRRDYCTEIFETLWGHKQHFLSAAFTKYGPRKERKYFPSQGNMPYTHSCGRTKFGVLRGNSSTWWATGNSPGSYRYLGIPGSSRSGSQQKIRLFVSTSYSSWWAQICLAGEGKGFSKGLGVRVSETCLHHYYCNPTCTRESVKA